MPRLPFFFRLRVSTSGQASSVRQARGVTQAAERPARRPMQRGVMLIEVLVGLVIFMIGALGLMGYVGRATADSVDARMRSQAALLSQQYFARLDAMITTAARGADLATYTTAINTAAPTLCAAWTTDTLQAERTGIPHATATCEVVPTAESVHVRLTISWRARATQSTDPLVNSKHQFVTQRPIV